MSSVIELVDNYESGRGSIRGNYRTKTRTLLVSPYDGWENVTGVPTYGDAWSVSDPNLKVVQMDYEGYGGLDSTATGPCKYEFAKVKVTYSTATGSDVPLARMEMAAELFTLGNVGTFVNSGNEVETPILMPVAMGSLIIPRRQYPEPTSTIMGLLGKINSASWNPLGTYSYPAKTVWFAGYNSQLVWDPSAGIPQFNIEYCFKINPQGWNVFWDGKAGAWDTITPAPYTAASFAGFPQ